MIKHSLLIYRQEFSVSQAIVVNALTKPVIANDEDLLEAIKNAVTEWARKTKEGREAFEYSGTDMNIGDLGGYEKDFIKFNQNIITLSFEQVDLSKEWHYDTSLVNDIEEDDYESSS
jgi:hypothetical protein